MKYFKEQLPYGLAGFLIILFLDIGNTFTKIVNSIGRYEFATITLVMLAIVCIYFRMDVSMKLRSVQNRCVDDKGTVYGRIIYSIYDSRFRYRESDICKV